MQSGNKDMEKHTLVRAAEHQKVTHKLAGEYHSQQVLQLPLQSHHPSIVPFLYSPGKGGKSSKTGKPSAGIKSSHSGFKNTALLLVEPHVVFSF